MKSFESIAADFYHSFYQKEWHGDSAAVRQLSMAEAYYVQDLITAKRISSGEHVMGFKIGCTSSAIREQFGINEPINGKLFHPYVLDYKERINWRDYINCAVEPEMVLKIGKDIKGIDLSEEEIIDSIANVRPGIEIHDYNFWIKPPTVQELICSGGIHKGLIIGNKEVSPVGLRFEDAIFTVYKNNFRITSAPGLEIMGSPILSLRWLVNFLTSKGLSLEKGSLVIPGSPVKLVEINQNTVLQIVIDNVGSLTTIFE